MPIIRPTKFAPHSLSREEFAELGRMVAWWGYVEYQAAVIIRVSCFKLSREEQWLLLGGAGIASLSGYLRTLAHSDFWIKDKGITDDIAAFADDVQKAAQKRNDYVHGVFGYVDNNPAQRVRISFRPRHHRTHPDSYPISESILKTLADDAEALWNRAEDLSNRIKALRKKLRASPGKSP